MATAQILPNAENQFVDINGAPLVGGTVAHYEPGTLVLMDTWQDYVHFLSAPCQYYQDGVMSEEDFCDFLVTELEDKILELGPENVMCFIAEPVLGSGGVIVPPRDYNRRCWEVVKKYDIVYIADEVVTAFGRLGHWFAS